MKRKWLPSFIMLTAGLITSIRTYFLHYEMKRALVTLLIVLIIFYILGSVLKYVLDIFEEQNEQKALNEGEVIEKETEGESASSEEDAITKE